MCGDVMQQRRGHRKHSFSDMCDRMDSSSLAALQGAFRRSAATAKQGALASARVVSRKRCGEAMVKEMCFGRASVAHKIETATCTVERLLCDSSGW
mmetsp:Transcript_65265/g.173043  ORF Transcript_65265/g.173043 Transcript_65265/m.173043 type:complete len:96 (-) Transcript_65265:58-345(-)